MAFITMVPRPAISSNAAPMPMMTQLGPNAPTAAMTKPTAATIEPTQAAGLRPG